MSCQGADQPPSLPNWCCASVQQSHTDCVVKYHMLVWLHICKSLSINAQKLAYSAKNSTRCPTDNSNASLYVIVGNCIGRQQRTGINFPAFHFRRWYFSLCLSTLLLLGDLRATKTLKGPENRKYLTQSRNVRGAIRLVSSDNSSVEPSEKTKQILQNNHLPKLSSQQRRVFCDSGVRGVLGYNTTSFVYLTTTENMQNSVKFTGECNRNFTVTDESIIYAIKSFPITSTKRPDGLTPLHLKDLTGPSAGIAGGKLLHVYLSNSYYLGNFLNQSESLGAIGPCTTKFLDELDRRLNRSTDKRRSASLYSKD
ncbi:hypothetical protein GJ496_001191 [Pomphorhynchus laevis]|nr:hypothetical protein GJ496_001191 [Pomphorhynchus laevis]